jgi:PPK2 family polyphosphate:nucleotide phosphotransferase
MTTSESQWSVPPAQALRVRPGFLLHDVHPHSTPGFGGGKKEAAAELSHGQHRLSQLQERLYAASRAGTTNASVLLVLQAMDSAGKGGIVRHVVGSVDPQGVSITAFKKPTPEELNHDFLWRAEKVLPEYGFIGVFDRSYYEDVLIGRVHALAPAAEIERRYDAINSFESRIVGSGVRLIKVMLHISYERQRQRLLERLDRPDKHWKYTASDTDQRAHWSDYMDAYQRVFDLTSTDAAPWHVIPADHKWYVRLAVQSLLIDALEDARPQWPVASYDVDAERRRLLAT